MPLYEFSCDSCHGVSEHLMKISDKSPEVCPLCGKHGCLKKLMSRTNFVLKGTGWYETDFKGAGEKKNMSSTSTDSSDSSSSSTESKKSTTPTTSASSDSSSASKSA